MIAILLQAGSVAQLGVPPPTHGYPQQDVLFDCDLREAENAHLPLESWSAKDDEIERFGWLLTGSATLLADADAFSMHDRGSTSVFNSGGVYSSIVDWPNRVEFGAASPAGRDANREDEFRTLNIDLARHRAQVVVINYEWPHGGDDDDRFITGGYFGDCRLVEGEAAALQFEDID